MRDYSGTTDLGLIIPHILFDLIQKLFNLMFHGSLLQYDKHFKLSCECAVANKSTYLFHAVRDICRHFEI
jgi:hypothetical protein